MSFAILRCENCGRVFPDYRGGKYTHCVNKLHCGATVPFTSETILPISYDIVKMEQHELDSAKENTSLPKYINKSVIFVNAFNNNVFLAAQVFSEDGRNSITVSLNEKQLGIPRDDVMKCIPEKFRYQLSRDGAYCFSGKYPAIKEIQDRINSVLTIVPQGNPQSE